MKVTAVLPCLNPDENFLRVVRELAEGGFTHIIVVNDGSQAECRPLFAQAEQLPGCEVLHHAENRGKGRALKTAFAHFLQNPRGHLGVVTVDGDGQHVLADIRRCAAALEEHPDSLVLGVRSFAGRGVPKRSALGNRLARLALRLLFGLHVSDSQTGLRGIPAAFTRRILDLDGERYELETNMLLEAKAQGLPVVELPIQTIYIDENAASHFRPVADSLRIFLPILRFAFSGLSSALVDIGLFALLDWALQSLVPGWRYLIAVAGARACSAGYNFLINRNLVFHSNTGYGGSLLRYGLLCVAQILCSYAGTFFLSEVAGLPAVLSKACVDLFLFFVSFRIQRRWVFPRR